MKISEDFMRSFRILTPLLLLMLNLIVALALFIGKGYLDEFKAMRQDVTNLKVDVAYIKGQLK